MHERAIEERVGRASCRVAEDRYTAGQCMSAMAEYNLDGDIYVDRILAGAGDKSGVRIPVVAAGL